jgi:hypothetical protein
MTKGCSGVGLEGALFSAWLVLDGLLYVWLLEVAWCVKSVFSCRFFWLDETRGFWHKCRLLGAYVM